MESIDNPPLSRLLCPAIRIKYTKSQSRKRFRYSSYNIVDNSFYLSNPEEDDLLRSHHLLPLFWCNNKETQILSIHDEDIEKSCGACWHNVTGTTYYFCNKCNRWYHKECVESPPMFKSPYHPKHPLQLYKFDYDSYLSCVECFSCGSYHTGLVYHCSVCNFNLDPVCVRKPPLINHKKRHEHTLSYFPRKFALICDVCGLDDIKSFIFMCLQCDFIVHRSCIYLPYVIKFSRHKHRLSFSYSLPSREWSCGVCRKKINETYGAYSCMTKDCIYGVHSKCATRPDLWDRKELDEGVPEEVNESVKPPFEDMGDGVILHFSHSDHQMRLDEKYDEKKQCQACMLPIYDGRVYTCTDMECDYVLHEACAYLPRVIQHASHSHPLTLVTSCIQTEQRCRVCERNSFGFKYECHHCSDQFVSLDVRCSSISEPYTHHSHQHPLFITTSPDRDKWDKCLLCECHVYSRLNCDECGFALCFGCATLPHQARYKNDEHLLTLTYEKHVDGMYWCDLCEETIDQRPGFYRCNECEVTLHIECLLGADLFLNPGSRIKELSFEFEIVQNNALITRPICSVCGKRCPYRMMFVSSDGSVYCSRRHVPVKYQW